MTVQLKDAPSTTANSRPKLLLPEFNTQCVVFSKHLTQLPLKEAAARLKSHGIHGIDLTVRPGGHIEPEGVQENLPQAFEILKNEGIRIGMISTEITDATSKTTGKILRTAASLGIKHYKIGYFRYKEFGSIRRLRMEVRSRLLELAALNQEIGIHGAYHNHSASFFGACLADIDFVLEGSDPNWLGFYFDPAHAVVEGGSSGWLMGLDLLIDRVTMLAVKDYRWVPKSQGYAGARLQGVQCCPLIEGNTPWPEVLKLLAKKNFSGPISLHSEYQGSHAFKDLTSAEVIEQTALDKKCLENWLAAD